MHLTLNNTFTNELPGDREFSKSSRQVLEACFSYVEPEKTSKPYLIHASKEVGVMLGLSKKDLTSTEFLEVVTGNRLLTDAKPYAMCYGGHQFGHWAGQLGDGRAINLAEVNGVDDRWVLQLKGAGRTPYSRTADGLAVLRSSIREYLCSEAMHHLGVPTTRALSLALTGDKVLRDVLYNGNPAYEKGAIVCRVAPTFIRFGSFEIFAVRDDVANLKKLADYTIKYFYPFIEQGTPEGYTEFFRQVSVRTLEMVIHWQRVGFVHGVMNTDNMSIIGQTIDYGPYGWLDDYNPNWTPNTTDAQHKRYRFGQQPNIALWDLVKLANALYPLINDVQPLEQILDEFKDNYKVKYLKMMKTKLGIFRELSDDYRLIQDLERVLPLTEVDMTIFFRNLADFDTQKVLDKNLDSDDPSFLANLLDAFYKPTQIENETIFKWREWVINYSLRLKQEDISAEERKIKMNAVNPKYVLRNYMAQLAIEAADQSDYSVLEELFEMLKMPYTDQPKNDKWFVKRPDWARTKVGCSMLSCSS